ncbi:MAG: hypothetical protein M0R77_02410 [Gammaproteobacteria bacterium]|nr:hypothetical protein [Gammaproteobacteria bacterium]
MTTKVNGQVAGAEFVGGDNQFFTVTATFSGANSALTLKEGVPTTGFDGSVGGTFDVDVNKTLFDVLVETIEMFETPIILGALAPGDLSFRFATNRVAGFKEAKDTGDTKQAVLSDALEAAIVKAASIDAGTISVAVTAAETI